MQIFLIGLSWRGALLLGEPPLPGRLVRNRNLNFVVGGGEARVVQVVHEIHPHAVQHEDRRLHLHLIIHMSYRN
eukprot:294064-Prorocentrum_minimum.AAC.2